MYKKNIFQNDQKKSEIQISIVDLNFDFFLRSLENLPHPILYSQIKS